MIALTWIAGALQLVVPSYAFRLIRRFGTSRVGWFVVTSFFALALVHLFAPLNPGGIAPVSGILLNVIYAVSSVLLLVGMGHIETLFAERDRTRSKEQKLRIEHKTQIENQTSDLIRNNSELLADIARRERVERDIRESENQYRSLFAENPQPMMILDLRTCRFVSVNKAALKQYGFDELEFLALSARDLVPEKLAVEFLRDVSKPCPGMESRGLWQHLRRDGTAFDVEITALDLERGDSTVRLILADDVTRRVQRDLELRQQQKMEIIAQISGGIAHHFSNVVTSIESQTALLMEKSADAGAAEQLKHLCAAVTRGAVLTRQLLAVGGRHSMQLEPVDLNGLIRNQCHTLRRLVGEQVVVQTVYGMGLPAVLADRYLLEHAMINLVLNARDAMPDGGSITINTTSVRLNEANTGATRSIGTSQYVRITVRDTGCGIPAEIYSRLYEPFFSTGKRAGLGLASVYGAVKQLSGWIEFTSEVGVGTEFRIFLPCAPVPAHLPQTTAAPAATTRGKGTVLLVEAEDRMRGLAHCVLNWNGYRVIEADSSSTAMILWDAQSSGIDLLITSVALPDVAGPELANHLRQTKPDLKVMFTGDPEAANAGQSLALFQNSKLVPTPYTPDKLLQEVNEFLGNVTAPAQAAHVN